MLWGTSFGLTLGINIVAIGWHRGQPIMCMTGSALIGISVAVLRFEIRAEMEKNRG